MFRDDNGLFFGSLCIDPRKVPVSESVFLSHAHSDHVKLSRKSNFFATPETIELIRKRFGEANFFEVRYGEKKVFDDFEFKLFPNGHILGSAQARFFGGGRDFVFTSDFRLRDSLLFFGAEPLSCDTLVIETTFGLSEYVFPAYDETVSEIISWIKKSAGKGLVLLSGHSLGKSQELTRIANEAGFEPLVHEVIFDFNKIYENHGVKLGRYHKIGHNLKDFSVLIMPPQLVGRHLFATLEHFDKRKIFSALVTGWGYKSFFDRTFKLSDHADFNELIEYVRLSNPKLVLTNHGFCEEFARKLNKMGFNAKPLKQHKQKMIGEF